MKKVLLAIAALTISMTAMSQDIDASKLSSYDKNAPFGFGASVTGGAAADADHIFTVENYDDLIAKVSPKNFNKDHIIVYVKGTITFPGQKELHGLENKTIIGLPGAAFENLNDDVATSSSDKDEKIKKTGILLIKNCKNIVIRNITFKSAGACDFNANDNLCLDGSTDIWVDHCDFQDGVDGNFDIVQGSNNVCVTWCRFRYLKEPRAAGYGGSSSDHRFTNLIGNSDKNSSTDQGKLCTSFANCWWDEGCKERMPRVRFGQVHLLNCLYSSSNTSYCAGGGYKSNIYMENCSFTSQKAKNTPWKCYATSTSYTDYNVTITNCANASNKQERSGSADYFIPSESYSYDTFKYDASLVESVVSNSTNGAGPTLQFTDPSGISTLTTAVVSQTEYYNMSGQQVDASTRGLVLMRQRMVDGTVRTVKVIR